MDSKPDSAVYRETYGAALYRAGTFPEAIEQLKIAVEKTGEGGSAWQQLFLAMAHHRLGNQQEARDSLTRVVRQIEAGLAEKHPGFEKWVEWHYLRAEAEATLNWRVPPETARPDR